MFSTEWAYTAKSALSRKKARVFSEMPVTEPKGGALSTSRANSHLHAEHGSSVYSQICLEPKGARAKQLAESTKATKEAK